jgi:hypothetical protein
MLKTVSSIVNAIGALNYKGTWNANTNSPALASGVGTKGDYYVVGTAGSTTLDGISNWGVGDWAAFNGSVWQRVEGGADLNGVNLTVTGTSTLASVNASGIASFANYAQLDYAGGTAIFANSSATTSAIGGTNGGVRSNYVQFDVAQTYPLLDNTLNLGLAAYRWKAVFAVNGTIQTSDENQKQDIAELDEAEKRVATRIKSLIKKYRFKDAVVEKGDAARIHVGAIAQEVQSAFVAEGLDATRYGVFCSDTWYEVDGKPSPIASDPYTENTPNAVPQTRLGLRYEELFAFVISVL